MKKSAEPLPLPIRICIGLSFLALFGFSLTRAPVSTGFLTAAVVYGALCGLLWIFKGKSKPHWPLMGLVCCTSVLLFGLDHSFSPDVREQFRWWLIVQWQGLMLITFLVIVATYTVATRSLANRKASPSEL